MGGGSRLSPQSKWTATQGRIQGRITGVTSQPPPSSLREQKLYYKDYNVSGYTDSEREGLTKRSDFRN